MGENLSVWGCPKHCAQWVAEQLFPDAHLCPCEAVKIPSQAWFLSPALWACTLDTRMEMSGPQQHHRATEGPEIEPSPARLST